MNSSSPNLIQNRLKFNSRSFVPIQAKVKEFVLSEDTVQKELEYMYNNKYLFIKFYPAATIQRLDSTQSLVLDLSQKVHAEIMEKIVETYRIITELKSLKITVQDSNQKLIGDFLTQGLPDKVDSFSFSRPDLLDAGSKLKLSDYNDALMSLNDIDATGIGFENWVFDTPECILTIFNSSMKASSLEFSNGKFTTQSKVKITQTEPSCVKRLELKNGHLGPTYESSVFINALTDSSIKDTVKRVGISDGNFNAKKLKKYLQNTINIKVEVDTKTSKE